MLDLHAYDAATFDCYGTLIDWRTGILEALGRLFCRKIPEVDTQALLELYARYETELEKGEYRPYAEILGGVVERIAEALSVSLDPGEREVLADSLAGWPVFPDTRAALRRLSGHYRLGVLSNVDDALFAGTAPNLGVTFDWVVTAEQVGSYKPAERNFNALLERVDLPRERILHVAQSLYHDVAPARRLGFSTVWVNRSSGRPGGVTPVADAVPHLEVPDLATLADLVEAAG